MQTPRMVFNAANAHVVRFGDRAMLLHVPTTALFELDELGQTLMARAAAQPEFDAEYLHDGLGARFAPQDIADFVTQLKDLEVLQVRGQERAINPGRVQVESYPLSTLVLNVNTGCNLSCSYCYKEDLQTPARGQRMDLSVASRSVDLLLKQAEARDSVSIVFFGGEPLTNVPLIRQVVDYAERRSQEVGKQVEFSLTTNATLLTSELIDFFSAHRFGISISIDGPKLIHDRNRRSVGGKGTYDVVMRKSRLLLERYRAKPIGARVTLTAGTTEVEEIHAHLRGELGFHEVGYAPVTSSNDAAYALSTDELTKVHQGFERLGREYLECATRGENSGFSNMHQLMTDLHEGRRKSLPCGAGVGLLAVDHQGGLNLCHRFTGSELPLFGDVVSGIDGERLSEFLGRAADRSGTHCATCRIRNLCAGGCYHEAYARFGDPLHRTYHYCDLLRRWVDFGIGVYAQILTRNPTFFRRHIETRRAHA
jgi:uncharacterized protein